ncbi:hypothetical protein BDZ97DRAFT_1652686, partial [Flammula alnicola]
IAVYLNWGFMGILCVQTYTYYIAFPNDRPLAKLIVYFVFALEVAQTVLVSRDVFAALAASVGSADPGSMIDPIYNHWFSVPVAGGISGGVGQLFFAYRIWLMATNGASGSQIITTSNLVLASASVVSALVSAGAFFHARTFSGLLDNSSSGSMAAIGVWNGVGAVCDITISLSMPYYLMRHGTGLPQTHIMVVKLVRLIIETGTFTAIVAILHLCLYFGNNQAFIVPGLTVSKIYANTMLVILNNRMEVVGGRTRRALDESNPDSPGGRMAFRSPANNSRTGRSTIIVSNDRLIFRLDDIPPMPKANSPKKSAEVDSSDSTSNRSAMVCAEVLIVRP